MTVEPSHCITCSDAAVTGVVVAVDGDTATVEVDGARERVGIELVGPIEVGARLVCHAGIAIAEVDG